MPDNKKEESSFWDFLFGQRPLKKAAEAAKPKKKLPPPSTKRGRDALKAAIAATKGIPKPKTDPAKKVDEVLSKPKKR